MERDLGIFEYPTTGPEGDETAHRYRPSTTGAFAAESACGLPLGRPGRGGCTIITEVAADATHVTWCPTCFPNPTKE